MPFGPVADGVYFDEGVAGRRVERTDAGEPVEVIGDIEIVDDFGGQELHPHGLVIGGETVEPESRYEIINPATEQVVAEAKVKSRVLITAGLWPALKKTAIASVDGVLARPLRRALGADRLGAVGAAWVSHREVRRLCRRRTR